MIRRVSLVAAFAVAIAGLSAPAFAAPCKDAKGKFIKCPAAATAPATRCKNANGKFAKCGTAGAVPMK
jgi:hypothetical protein